MRTQELPQPPDAERLLEGITDPEELHSAQLILAQCVEVDYDQAAKRARQAYIASLNILPPQKVYPDNSFLRPQPQQVY
jgi:hypothetical protein